MNPASDLSLVKGACYQRAALSSSLSCCRTVPWTRRALPVVQQDVWLLLPCAADPFLLFPGCGLYSGKTSASLSSKCKQNLTDHICRHGICNISVTTEALFMTDTQLFNSVRRNSLSLWSESGEASNTYLEFKFI